MFLLLLTSVAGVIAGLLGVFHAGAKRWGALLGIVLNSVIFLCYAMMLLGPILGPYLYTYLDAP